MGEPLTDALKTMHVLSDRLRSAKLHEEQALLERAVGQVETSQKWLRELQVALRGGKTQQSRFDVTHSILRVAERIGQDDGADVELEVLMPPNLPRVAGTTVVFERLLTQLVHQRLSESRPGRPLTLLARTIGGEQPRGVLVSLVDTPDAELRQGSGQPPEVVSQGLASMGGEALCVEDSRIGRVTSMHLAVASA